MIRKHGYLICLRYSFLLAALDIYKLLELARDTPYLLQCFTHIFVSHCHGVDVHFALKE
jgi:hypothetical protein